MSKQRAYHRLIEFDTTNYDPSKTTLGTVAIVGGGGGGGGRGRRGNPTGGGSNPYGEVIDLLEKAQQTAARVKHGSAKRVAMMLDALTEHIRSME